MCGIGEYARLARFIIRSPSTAGSDSDVLDGKYSQKRRRAILFPVHYTGGECLKK